MREFFIELWANRILIAALTGWAVAQLLKTLIYAVLYRDFNPERLIGSGGMPSSHAATVCALCVCALRHCGVASPIFALAFIQTIVVLHDARGVRYETGKQAQMITAITEFIEKTTNQDVFPEMELKELVGHTPLQVLVGAIIGVIVGLLV